MASLIPPLTPLTRTLAPRSPRLLSCPHHYQQVRTAAGGNAAKYRAKAATLKMKKKKKGRSDYILPDMKLAEQYNLCDAMRYIRAFEVGRAPNVPKYEIAVRMRTPKNGPVVRNRLRLPHPVDTSTRICVICPPDSKYAKAATAAGAALVGEQEVFDRVKAGDFEFDRCICQQDSLQALNKAGLGRQLGPKGLMPSAKLGTVVRDVGAAVRDMMGGSEYRERQGVVRMAVGQLGYGPDEMQRNIKAFMESVKKDCAQLSDKVTKEVHEVVLSSTGSPGFSLNGDFKGAASVSTSALSV